MVYSFTKRRNKPGFSGVIKIPITIRELLITLEDVKKEAENEDFIKKGKSKFGWTRKQKKNELVCHLSQSANVLSYADSVVMPYTLQKKIQ